MYPDCTPQNVSETHDWEPFHVNGIESTSGTSVKFFLCKICQISIVRHVSGEIYMFRYLHTPKQMGVCIECPEEIVWKVLHE